MAKEEAPAGHAAEPSSPAELQPPKVEIFTERFGAGSIRAKGLLDRKGVSYSEYAIDQDVILKAQMIKRCQGDRQAPQIFVDNRPIGGWDELNALERQGSLDRLLGLGGGDSKA